MARDDRFEFRIRDDASTGETVISMLTQVRDYLRHRFEIASKRNSIVLDRANRRIQSAEQLLKDIDSKKGESHSYRVR